MSSEPKSLFDLVVDPNVVNPSFEARRTQSGSEPARWMLNDIFQEFDDPDGNFVEQFQSTGFDARFFELYLFAYLLRSRFDVHRDHPNPDFIVSRAGMTATVEATTVNPSTSGVLSKLGGDPGPLQFNLRHPTNVECGRGACKSGCGYQGSTGCGDLRLDPTATHATADRARRDRANVPIRVRIQRRADDLLDGLHKRLLRSLLEQ